MLATDIVPVVSDFAGAEFTSVISREVRMRLMSREAAETALGAFDEWSLQDAQVIMLASADIALATTWLRRLNLNLRAPDALHLAMASRLTLPILTFDAAMVTAARALGLVPAES